MITRLTVNPTAFRDLAGKELLLIVDGENHRVYSTGESTDMMKEQQLMNRQLGMVMLGNLL